MVYSLVVGLKLSTALPNTLMPCSLGVYTSSISSTYSSSPLLPLPGSALVEMVTRMALVSALLAAYLS